MGYDFKWVHGYAAVYLNGVFLFSADTMKEAHDELNKKDDENEDVHYGIRIVPPQLTKNNMGI